MIALAIATKQRMNPQSIIILVGEAGSGKSETLHAMVKEHCARISTHVYSMKDKKLYLSLSSPQEYPEYDFCDFNWVIDKVRLWIGKCKREGCMLLIAPFQISISRKTDGVNADCIKQPIDQLKKNFKVHVVYMRKNGSRNKPRVLARLSRIDNLVRGLKDEEIESRKGETKLQADELWAIVMKLDS